MHRLFKYIQKKYCRTRTGKNTKLVASIKFSLWCIAISFFRIFEKEENTTLDTIIPGSQTVVPSQKCMAARVKETERLFLFAVETRW